VGGFYGAEARHTSSAIRPALAQTDETLESEQDL
jgi:hypothetical protein